MILHWIFNKIMTLRKFMGTACVGFCMRCRGITASTSTNNSTASTSPSTSSATSN